jgi:hypothetical protein
MGVQIIVEAADAVNIATALGSAADQCEMFPMGSALLGVSIPSRVVDLIGEQVLLRKLGTLKWYDLWEGKWN